MISSRPWTILAAVSAAFAAPTLDNRQALVDNTLPRGTNPITKFTTQLLGRQVADNSCSHRDLGFTGEIAGSWYAVYGDTLWCAPGVTNPGVDNTTQFHGMVRDSVSLMTRDPLVVQDLIMNTDSPVAHQLQFVPFNAAWNETNTYGFGGTSICEVDAVSKTGMVFYLVNANAYVDNTGLKGAGVGRVQVINGTPIVVERYGDQGHWWNSSVNVQYGDKFAYRDVNSEYIYAWGAPPNSITDWVQFQYVYLCRVKAASAFDLSSYEYWWGREVGWSSEVHTTFNKQVAVMWEVGQGQIVYSKFFRCYIFVHLDVGSNVLLRTAKKLEGPWTPDVTVYTDTPETADYPAYAGVAYPHLDKSGQTLTVGWTNNNKIQVLKISFYK